MAKDRVLQLFHEAMVDLEAKDREGRRRRFWRHFEVRSEVVRSDRVGFHTPLIGFKGVRSVSRWCELQSSLLLRGFRK